MKLRKEGQDARLFSEESRSTGLSPHLRGSSGSGAQTGSERKRSEQAAAADGALPSPPRELSQGTRSSQREQRGSPSAADHRGAGPSGKVRVVAQGVPWKGDEEPRSSEGHVGPVKEAAALSGW